MDIGIIGFSKAGTTTVFNALTHNRASTAAYTIGALQPNLGVAKVPDDRLEVLAGMYRPDKVVHAEVRYTDIPWVAEGSGGEAGITGEFLNLLQRADAFVHVVRAFDDPAVPFPQGSVDPERDVSSMELELAFADMSIVERRAVRVGRELKGAKQDARRNLLLEGELLSRVGAELENGVPIHVQNISSDERKSLNNFQFLTSKPVLEIVNIGEEQLGEVQAIEERLRLQLGRPWRGFIALCGVLEMELEEMSRDEESEFRAYLGAGPSALEQAVRASYKLLDQVSFLTVGDDEVRAWTVPRNLPAVQAARKIHSDIERGFIRAEVIAYSDLMQCKNMTEARERGLLRLEGKSYPVQDGDVISFRFNV
jgi:GTP-binding protein YchF